MLHEMTITALTVDPKSQTPVVVLKPRDGRDAELMIWIGVLEATSIVYALQEIRFERPLTHDLFKLFLETNQYKISKVEICDLKENTFFAKIYFTLDEKEFFMDARPSDAIAMAVRFSAPVFAAEHVLQSVGSDPEPVEIADDSDEGKKWAEYLKNLSKDDFGKYKV